MNPTTDLAARFEAKREDAIEAAARAYYDGMIGRPEDQWPHHDGWAGKSETFKAKVRVHMARALEAAAEARDMARAGAAGGAGNESTAGFDAARAEYARWSTGGDTSRPAGERNWTCRQNDNGTWAITTYHQHYNEADQARHEQALAAAIQAAAPPPPAQQGSSSPPLTAERVDLGELERLNERAAPGLWRNGPRCIFAKSTNPHIGGDDVVVSTAYSDRSHDDDDANCAYIVALVNAHRAGHLVPASLPAGTGSADEGTGLGAPATPSGHSRAEPFGLGPLAECPSRGALLTIAAIIQDWLDWDASQRNSEGLRLGPDNHIVIPPTWPNRNQFEHWIKALKDAAGLAVGGDLKAEARAALARMKAREGEDIDEWAEKLAADSARMGEAEYSDSVRDRSGEAGETTGSPEGKSPASQGATPETDPVGEAKALLEGWQPIATAPKGGIDVDLWSIHGHRWTGFYWDSEVRGGGWADGRDREQHWRDRRCVPESCMTHWRLPPDPPPGFRLATLHASQDQAGEVRL